MDGAAAGAAVRQGQFEPLRAVGAAWITGESELLIDDDDPLRDGFVL